MRPVTIQLPEDTYSHIELLAARDNLRIAEGIESFLIELAAARMDKREIKIVQRRDTA